MQISVEKFNLQYINCLPSLHGQLAIHCYHIDYDIFSYALFSILLLNKKAIKLSNFGPYAVMPSPILVC